MFDELPRTRRDFIAVAATATACAVLPRIANAYDEQSVSAINVDSKGVILKGYDAVSYFAAGGPVQGSSSYSVSHDGAVYWFASAANRDVFKANPGKYTPSFGGFCAMGVAMGKKLDVDPQLWRIVDGKLHLNVHKAAQTRWLEDVKGNLLQADKNWPGIKDKMPKAL